MEHNNGNEKLGMRLSIVWTHSFSAGSGSFDLVATVGRYPSPDADLLRNTLLSARRFAKEKMQVRNEIDLQRWENEGGSGTAHKTFVGQLP